MRRHHATGDFTQRSKWREGISRVEDVNHRLPRVGMQCRVVLTTGEVITCLSRYYSYQSGNIEFWENELENGRTFHYVLQQLEENQTGLTLEVYFSKEPDTEFQSGEDEVAKLRGELERSMETLATISKD